MSFIDAPFQQDTGDAAFLTAPRDLGEDAAQGETLLTDPIAEGATLAQIKYQEAYDPDNLPNYLKQRKEVFNTLHEYQSKMPSGIRSWFDRQIGSFKGFVADPVNDLSFGAADALFTRVGEGIIGNLAEHDLASRGISAAVNYSAKFGRNFTGLLPQSLMHVAVASDPNVNESYTIWNALANNAVNALGLTTFEIGSEKALGWAFGKTKQYFETKSLNKVRDALQQPPIKFSLFDTQSLRDGYTKTIDQLRADKFADTTPETKNAFNKQRTSGKDPSNDDLDVYQQKYQAALDETNPLLKKKLEALNKAFGDDLDTKEFDNVAAGDQAERLNRIEDLAPEERSPIEDALLKGSTKKFTKDNLNEIKFSNTPLFKKIRDAYRGFSNDLGDTAFRPTGKVIDEKGELENAIESQTKKIESLKTKMQQPEVPRGTEFKLAKEKAFKDVYKKRLQKIDRNKIKYTENGITKSNVNTPKVDLLNDVHNLHGLRRHLEDQLANVNLAREIKNSDQLPISNTDQSNADNFNNNVQSDLTYQGGRPIEDEAKSLPDDETQMRPEHEATLEQMIDDGRVEDSDLEKIELAEKEVQRQPQYRDILKGFLSCMRGEI